MRKILFIVLIGLLLIGTGFFIANGLKLGNFQVWGVRKIIEENNEIDNKNLELSNIVSVTYPDSLGKLKTSSNGLATKKLEYEEKALLISNSEYYMQTEKYEIEFLWTKLGNYAKDNNVIIKIDVVNSTTAKLYDLKFTIAGQYIDVIQFIYDVENDSKLGFKIEEFHMSAVEGGVQGTFTCKEIGINIEIIQSKPQTNATSENNNTTSSNTTSETNSTTTANNANIDA